MQWFYDLSIRKKFYGIFGMIILATLAGIVVGQISIKRIQVGGVLYQETIPKNQLINLLGGIINQMNTIRGDGLLLMMSYDGEIADRVNAAAAEVDRQFQEVSQLAPGQGQALDSACYQCHKAEDLAATFADLPAALQAWQKLKGVITDRILPAVKNNDTSSNSASIVTLEEGFGAISQAINPILEVLREVSPIQLQKIVSEADFVRQMFIAGGFFTTIFLVIIAYLFSSMIVNPVQAVAHFSKMMAQGRFAGNIDIKVKGADELGEMAESFKTMSQSLRKIFRQIIDNGIEIKRASEQLSSAAVELVDSSQRQSRESAMMAEDLGAILRTTMEVADDTGKASSTAEESYDVASMGKDTSGYAINSIKKGASVVNEAAQLVEALGARSQEIGKIVSVINDIARQTNLLALNAAVESARAGRHGKGFAVVAGEVRQLATRSGKATEEIRGKMEMMQEELARVVETMRQSRENADKSVKLINAVSQSYDSIVTSSSETSVKVQRISAAMERQSKSAESTNQYLNKINELNQAALEQSAAIREDVAILAKSSKKMAEASRWFKIEDTAVDPGENVQDSSSNS